VIVRHAALVVVAGVVVLPVVALAVAAAATDAAVHAKAAAVLRGDVAVRAQYQVVRVRLDHAGSCI
jgi:hypothetical protein